MYKVIISKERVIILHSIPAGLAAKDINCFYEQGFLQQRATVMIADSWV